MNFIDNYFNLLFILAVILHLILGICINKIYERKENKKTAMAYIPLANIYLLGSLTIHKIVGWLLIIIIILNFNYPIINDDKIIIKRILPMNLNSIINLFILLSVILLFILLILKLINNKEKANYNEQFLTPAELMKNPTYLKQQSKLNYQNHELPKKDSQILNDMPKPLNIPKHQVNTTNTMPKPFNSQSNFNQNRLNNNQFNNRKF